MVVFILIITRRLVPEIIVVVLSNYHKFFIKFKNSNIVFNKKI